MIAVLAIAGSVTGLIVLHQNQPVLISMFDSGQPGTQAFRDGLLMAADKSAKIDEEINYSLLNADKSKINGVLSDSHILHVKQVVPLKDIIGCKDLDPDLVDEHFHHQFTNQVDPNDPCIKQAVAANGGQPLTSEQLDGINTDAEFEAIVNWFENSPYHSVISRYYLSDELPGSLDDVAQNLPLLKHRFDELHRITKKHALVTMYNNGDGNQKFLGMVKTATDDLVGDYYAYPDNTRDYGNPPGPDGQTQTYGTVAYMGTMAAAVVSSAGSKHSGMAIQAFSYAVNEPDNVTHFHFPPNPAKSNQGAPPPDVMVQTIRDLVKAHVKNILFYFYPYMTQIPGETQAVQSVIRTVRNWPEFKH